MVELRFTRNLFLRCICVIFLFAFTSLYVQIPGLYGKNGILPARTQIVHKGSPKDLAAHIQKKPTLLWFAKALNLETEHAMEILCLLGMFFSFTGFVSHKCCTKAVFASLWSLYFSLYQVGQTFMWFQWDVLLLETGFICILLAPWIQGNQKNNKPQPTDPVDHVNFWLVKWLLFRLLFSSGVVKLTSGCPSWWSLKALSVHFESQCIPTSLAWYFHHYPAWFLRLGTVYANFVEIALPPLFFVPNKAVRTIAFWLEVFLQVSIIISGNFNFFNYLTIVLCLSLLDDSNFVRSPKKQKGWASTILTIILTLFVYASLLFGLFKLYGITINDDKTIGSNINFTPAEFDKVLGYAIPILSCIGVISLLWAVVGTLKATSSQAASSFIGKGYSYLKSFSCIAAAILIFTDSLVVFTALHPTSADKIVFSNLKSLHESLSVVRLTNEYGLFRKMTGVGGRPEVILEGSNDMNGPWIEYHFKYKPGDVKVSPPFVAPHQPRLDWQLWFAALGTYHQNPWIMSLAYRMLKGQKEVLELLDTTRLPFPSKAPKFVRAGLYHYHFTSAKQRAQTGNIWTRAKVGEYFPVFAQDHGPLIDYLKGFGIIGDEAKEDPTDPRIVNALNYVRSAFVTVEPNYLLLTLIISGLVIIKLSSLSSPVPPAKPQHHQSQSKGKRKNK